MGDRVISRAPRHDAAGNEFDFEPI